MSDPNGAEKPASQHPSPEIVERERRNIRYAQMFLAALEREGRSCVDTVAIAGHLLQAVRDQFAKDGQHDQWRVLSATMRRVLDVLDQPPKPLLFLPRDPRKPLSEAPPSA